MPYPYDDDRAYLLRMTWPLSVIFVLMLLSAMVFGIFGSRRTIPEPSLRGGMVMMIQRRTGQLSADRITIYDDRLAAREVLPHPQNFTYGRASLSAQAWEAIDDVRRQWCTTSPKLTERQPTHERYEVGIRCSPRRQKVIRVSPDALPAAFANLMETIPTPQAPPP